MSNQEQCANKTNQTTVSAALLEGKQTILIIVIPIGREKWFKK